jgi:outer membrane protein assembly factor BamE
VVLGLNPSWYISVNSVICHLSKKIMSYFLKLLFTLLFVCGTLLTGCGASVPAIVKPYKMDIQQGNVVTSKMLLQLKPGMTKSQVRFIMGTPLIVDDFHKNRWDYFYQMRQQGKIIEQRRVILEFDKDLLSKVRGDVVPQGTAGAETGAEAGAVMLPKSIEPKPKEKGLLDKLKFWEKDDKKPAAIEAAPIVAPKEIVPVAPATDVVEPAQDVPSVLAVPIGVTPAGDLPAVAPAKKEPEKEPAVNVEPLKAAPAVVEVPEAVPAPATPQAVPSAPVPAAPEQAAPPASSRPAAKKDEPFSFRMDKDLDSRNIEATDAPKDVVPTAADNKTKPKNAEPAPLPAETEPSFFDRMLEKIGF